MIILGATIGSLIFSLKYFVKKIPALLFGKTIVTSVKFEPNVVNKCAATESINRIV